VAWFRAFASDNSGAVSIEFVVLCASLMGVGTLSAVTVQSGALVRAGIIGEGLDEAQQLARDTNVPLVLPEIGPQDSLQDGTTLPGSQTEPTGSSEVAEIGQVGHSGGGYSGGGFPVVGGGSSGEPDDCPALIEEPDDLLNCDEQAAEDI
jgi:hypothetical protein